MHRQVTEEDMQNKHMERCTAPLTIREIQIKITLRQHHSPIVARCHQKPVRM